MAELKTKKTNASVAGFVAKIRDSQRRDECRQLIKLMKSVSGKTPRMWGASIVGFGDYHYEYQSGRSGDWFLMGFSPRKQNLTIYALTRFAAWEPLLAKLGKFKTGESCLYIKRLEDIDLKILAQLLARAIRRVPKKST